jgi:hypothetical protein
LLKEEVMDGMEVGEEGEGKGEVNRSEPAVVCRRSDGGRCAGGGEAPGDEDEKKGKKIKKWWVPRLEGGMEGLQEWRASRNGGCEGEFGGVCKMEACLEALLEMDFCTKPPNFGVDAHMEAPAGDALSLFIFVSKSVYLLT